MKAVQAGRFGGPEVLAPTDLPDPEPDPGQVAIDVTHAAVGLIDVYIRQGLYRDRPGLPQPPYVPGLEVAGTVRALGEGVTGLRTGQPVVARSDNGTGGYASIYIAAQHRVVPAEGIDPALAAAVLPNAIMAHVALTPGGPPRARRKRPRARRAGRTGGGLPGHGRHLGAGRVVGTVRSERAAAAAATRLPYATVVDSAHLPAEKFDVIIDPVGGDARTRSLDLLAPFGRLLLVGNASGDWDHRLPSNPIWGGNLVVAGFNAGVHLPAHPETIPPAAEAARQVIRAGLADTELELLPLEAAATAHERLENHAANGRLILTTA